jgi:hypothetical protein
MILLGILLCVPETESQDSIVIFVRDENGLIDETFLFLQDWQYLVSDGFGKLFVLAWLGG